MASDQTMSIRVESLAVNVAGRSIVKYLILSLRTVLILGVTSVGYAMWQSFKLPEDHPAKPGSQNQGHKTGVTKPRSQNQGHKTGVTKQVPGPNAR